MLSWHQSAEELDAAEILAIAEAKRQYGKHCYNIGRGGCGGDVYKYASNELREQRRYRHSASTSSMMRARWQSDDGRLAMLAGLQSAVYRRNRSIAAKARYATDTDLHRRVSEGGKRRFENTAERKRLSDAIHAHWNNPANRQRHIAELYKPGMHERRCKAQRRIVLWQGKLGQRYKLHHCS